MIVLSNNTFGLKGAAIKRLAGIFAVVSILAMLFFACKQQQSLDKNKTYQDSITGVEFVFVKGGCFQMGNPTPDETDLYDSPVHEVCLNDFYIGKYEVTQQQWNLLMEPIADTGCGEKCPVRGISWDHVQIFINKLNQQTGKKYRLPTSAEWEYAASSGGKNKLYSGTDDLSKVGEYAWYYNTPFDSDTMVHPVGEKKPNKFGLYDMTGNVFEWVSDWHVEYYYRNSPKDNPQGPDSGQYRTVRGGRNWVLLPWDLRITSMAGWPSDESFGLVGFRLVYQAQQ
jgi:sulfatase modifying factor 1